LQTIKVITSTKHPPEFSCLAHNLIKMSKMTKVAQKITPCNKKICSGHYTELTAASKPSSQTAQ
jgi:hypothetical protein